MQDAYQIADALVNHIGSDMDTDLFGMPAIILGGVRRAVRENTLRGWQPTEAELETLAIGDIEAQQHALSKLPKGAALDEALDDVFVWVSEARTGA